MILFTTNLTSVACVPPTLAVMQGVGISTFNPKQKQYPLVNGMDAARNSASKENAR